MPVKSWLRGFLLLVLASAGCDTTEPLQVKTQDVELRFSAGNAGALQGNVGIRSFITWMLFEDGDLDTSTDDPIDFDMDGSGDFFLFCENLGQFDTHNEPTSVPWSYRLQVSVIRAGETEAELLTSPAALAGDPAVNLTAYDGTNTTGATGAATRLPICLNAAASTTACRVCSVFGTACNTNNDCSTAETCDPNPAAARMFRFVDNTRRKLSQATRLVATSTSNPLSSAVPAFNQVGSGRCSAMDPGPVAVDCTTPPNCPDSLTLQINKGDTLVVEARRGDAPPPGLPVAGNLSGKVTLNAALFVDGVSVNVDGPKMSGPQPGAGFKFTYTSR